MSKTYLYIWWILAWSPSAWGLVQLEINTGKRWIETSHRTGAKFPIIGQETSAAFRVAPYSKLPLALGLSYGIVQLNPANFLGSPSKAQIEEVGGELFAWLPVFDRLVPFLTLQALLNGRLLVRYEDPPSPEAPISSRLHGGRILIGMSYRVLPISSVSVSAFRGWYTANDIEGEKRGLNAIGVAAGFDLFW